MPEGDSIHRLRAQLAPVLEGKEVTAFTARRLPGDVGLVGHRIVEVAARGKNLLIRFDDGRVLHVHLRMNGRMWVERPRSKFWAPSTAEPHLRIAVGARAVVGRDLPVVRLLTALQVNATFAELGPDLVDEGYDEERALVGLRARGDREIGEALLVQRVAAGIGNVYKSEVLFLEGIDPRRRVEEIAEPQLRAVLRRASELLRRNLGRGPRTTRPTLAGPRLWVYGRGGKPCLRCSRTILRFTQAGRSTYFCPACQS
jgi:endonuclease-8